MSRGALILIMAGASWLAVAALVSLLSADLSQALFRFAAGLIASGALAGMLTDRRAVK